MARRLLILGSTGSIGTQALEIVERSDEIELVGLTAERSWEALVEQARAHGVERIALADPDAAARAAEAWTDGEVLTGPEGLMRLVIESGADLVLNALVGSVGLGPTVATLGEGIDLALANKESLVVGGELVTQLAEATGAQIIPVDSEHSALHQLISAERPGTDRQARADRQRRPVPRSHARGPRGRDRRGGPPAPHVGDGRQDHDRLGHADEQGPRADRGPSPVRHRRTTASTSSCTRSRSCTPTSSCVTAPRLAHLGHPDMRVPISYALHYPDRVDVPVRPLDLAEVGALTFEPVDTDAFPCLRLAREAAAAGGTAPCVLNAANEVAVHAFLNGRLDFLGIPAVIETALERLPAGPVRAFESLHEADREARAVASELIAVRI